MKRREFLKTTVGSALMLGSTGLTSWPASGESGDTKMTGRWVECCSCNVPCPCPVLENFKEHCMVAFALVLDSATFGGSDLSAAKVGWGGHAGNLIHLYVDATESQQEAATSLAKTLFSDFGKVGSIRYVRIDLSGEHGRYKLTLDGGQICEMVTEPVLGADKKTPIRIVNGLTEWLPTIMQARTVRGRYSDGAISFNLESTNAYFDDGLDYRGKLLA